MRHARLRHAVTPPTAGRHDRLPPSSVGGGSRRLQLTPIDLRPPPHVMQPERQLMAAVLVDAVATWRRYRRAREPLARSRLAEVVAWLEDTSTSWPFSFARICAELDLDAARIRKSLR
jgi:hypothetical protein